MATDIIIYHNPACGTSRNTLAMIRHAGIEPHVVEYLLTPPSRALLEQLIARAGITPRALLRQKGTPFADLGLAALYDPLDLGRLEKRSVGMHHAEQVQHVELCFGADMT